MIAALLVGGTFVVVTMAGMEEARRLAGPRARALMAAMTSAFALGQILGPVIVSLLVQSTGGFAPALILRRLGARPERLFIAEGRPYVSETKWVAGQLAFRTGCRRCPRTR